MATNTETARTVEALSEQRYKYGFVTDIEADSAPPGLNEEIVRFISAKKGEPEWLLDWRLRAYHRWMETAEDTPSWAHLDYPEIDYQASSYYSAPLRDEDRPKSLDEIDPELLKTYEKLGIPLQEQEMLS